MLHEVCFGFINKISNKWKWAAFKNEKGFLFSSIGFEVINTYFVTDGYFVRSHSIYVYCDLMAAVIPERRVCEAGISERRWQRRSCLCSKDQREEIIPSFGVFNCRRNVNVNELSK